MSGFISLPSHPRRHIISDLITGTLDADVHKLNTKLQLEPSHLPSVLTLFLFSSSFYADYYNFKQKKTRNPRQSLVFQTVKL